MPEQNESKIRSIHEPTVNRERRLIKHKTTTPDLMTIYKKVRELHRKELESLSKK